MLDLYATITFFVLIWNMFFNGTYFPGNTMIFIDKIFSSLGEEVSHNVLEVWADLVKYILNLMTWLSWNLVIEETS